MAPLIWHRTVVVLRVYNPFDLNIQGKPGNSVSHLTNYLPKILFIDNQDIIFYGNSAHNFT